MYLNIQVLLRSENNNCKQFHILQSTPDIYLKQNIQIFYTLLSITPNPSKLPQKTASLGKL